MHQKVPYTLADIKIAGFDDDNASSVAMPYGVSVNLYDGEGFTGDMITLDGPFYEDETLKHTCVSIYEKFNDDTSSLEVFKTAQLGESAKGYWRSITQTETLKFTVMYGMQLVDKKSEKTSKESALRAEMKSGISFFEAQIGKSYAEKISLDTERTYSYTTSVNYTITCTAKPDSPGVGLWQWVVESSDGQTSVLTPHTVCRYGEIYSTPPACPWNACLGSSPDCSKCTDDWNYASSAKVSLLSHSNETKSTQTYNSSLYTALLTIAILSILATMAMAILARVNKA